MLINGITNQHAPNENTTSDHGDSLEEKFYRLLSSNQDYAKN